MIYTESEIDSLGSFLRVESPLVTFARSLRNEEANQQTQAEADPFAGIDFDNLPDEIKDQLTKVKESVATLQLTAKTTNEKLTQTEELARKEQARADRNYQKLKDHNLDPDAKANPLADEDSVRLNAMVKEYTDMGIDPKVALTQAKIQLVSNKQTEKLILEKVGKGLVPMASAVGDMVANRFLSEAQLPKNDPEGILQIPEINKQVTESLGWMTQQGQAITADTVENLRDMAYGRYIRNTPEDKRVKQTKEQPMNFSTGGTQYAAGNGAVARLQFDAAGKPKAANADTQAAIDATMGSMLQGFKDLRGKGKGGK